MTLEHGRDAPLKNSRRVNLKVFDYSSEVTIPDRLDIELRRVRGYTLPTDDL